MEKRPKLVYKALPRSNNEQIYVFSIVGANGETQMRSEPYDSQSNAERGYRDLVNTICELEVADES